MKNLVRNYFGSLPWGMRIFLLIFVLGFPRMGDKEWRDLVNDLEGDRPPYEILLGREMRPLLEAVLTPTPDQIAEAVDPDMRDFYRELYSRPEMTNPTWLSVFRIISLTMRALHPGHLQAGAAAAH
jgi:hypothetical protein